MLSTYGRPHDAQSAFERGPNGKPFLADGAGDRRAPLFNLAHTRGLVAAVVTHHADVGIDVEPLERGADALGLARRYFSGAEVRELERCSGVERDIRFTELWTLKEAFVKATGTGIANELRGCSFTFDGSTSLVFEPADGAQAGAWAFALFDVGGYRLAVAVRDTVDNIEALSVCEHADADVHGNTPVAGSSARLLRASPGLVASCSFS